MTKKHFLSVLAALGLFLTSCKKDYSCLCVTTFSETGYNPYTVSSNQKIDKKTTKKTAEKICTQTEKQLGENHKDYTSGNEKVSVSCALN